MTEAQNFNEKKTITALRLVSHESVSNQIFNVLCLRRGWNYVDSKAEILLLYFFKSIHSKNYWEN